MSLEGSLRTSVTSPAPSLEEGQPGGGWGVGGEGGWGGVWWTLNGSILPPSSFRVLVLGYGCKIDPGCPWHAGGGGVG